MFFSLIIYTSTGYDLLNMLTIFALHGKMQSFVQFCCSLLKQIISIPHIEYNNYTKFVISAMISVRITFRTKRDAA